MVRFIAEVECSRALRVGHRTGMVFPAHLTSGGLAMLAELDDEAITELYAEPGEDEEAPDFLTLLPRLTSIRQQGFALNHGLSEQGHRRGRPCHPRRGGPRHRLAGRGDAGEPVPAAGGASDRRGAAGDDARDRGRPRGVRLTPANPPPANRRANRPR